MDGFTSLSGSNALKKLSKKDVNIDGFKNELLKDPEISSKIKGIDLDLFFVQLMDYKENRQKCVNCRGLKECTQDEIGYKPILDTEEGIVDVQFEACMYQKAFEKQQATKLKTLHLPEKLSRLTLDDIFKDEERSEILAYFEMFRRKYVPGKNFQKGMYIHGKPGMGKTYLLCAMANELSREGHSVAVVYYPDLIRELKSSIGDGTLVSKIENLKMIDILLLDDIGAEKVTEYTRDEILGAIIQFRMMDEKPTFFTSNLTQKELLAHLSSDESGTNRMKGLRIMERICTLSTQFELNGERYRK